MAIRERAGYLREWRKSHPERQAEYDSRRDKVLRRKWERNSRIVRMEFIRALKEIAGCKKCGNRNFRVLDFHHRNPKTKVIGIVNAAMRGWTLQKIWREVGKCDILCSNCHRIETYESGQYHNTRVGK